MEYYFSKVLKAGFEDAEKQTVEALKKEGFGDRKSTRLNSSHL